MDAELGSLYEKIYKEALYLTHGHKDLARDLTQDAFLCFYSIINRGGVVKYPLAYLRKAVRNLLINKYDRDHRRIEDPVDYQALEHRNHCDILLDTYLAPESILCRNEIEELRAALLGESLS